MENNENQKSIKESILDTIKSGHVEMRPKWHFVLKAALAALGAVIILLTIFYLASFIIFVLRQTGVLFVPAFGLPGWFAFFTHLPIFLIFLLIIFLIVLELLVRHYAFAYRRPLLYSALGILILITIGGIVLANTSLHRDLSRGAKKNQGSFAGGFYRQFDQQNFRDVHRGAIIEFIGNGFEIKNRREETLMIIVTPQTRLPYGADFSIGDIVVVFGDRDGDIVRAFGIQEVGE